MASGYSQLFDKKKKKRKIHYSFKNAFHLIKEIKTKTMTLCFATRLTKLKS